GKKKKRVDAKEVDASIKETLAKLEDKGKHRRKKKKLVGSEEIEVETAELDVTEFISAQELANLMDIGVNEVIKKAMEMGLLISINQRLDQDTITLLADEFDYTVNFVSSVVEVLEEEIEEEAGTVAPRAPVVTVMGHVDHGKTSLLDYIRRSNIIAGESGGITQHIGAYKVDYNGRHITFLDTPGHEAFTAMRARGAQVTDIVVLVVAADDQVMPQTIEAINHAQAANVPIIIAINKVDKANAQPEKVRQQLADKNILVEDWGGKYQCTEISAKFGQGIDKLMEEILLLADMLEVTSAIDCRARGVVIDSKLDKGRGAIATVLIQRGTLHVGDNFVADQYAGRVRALLDERGKPVDQVGPSDPVQILGFEGIPQAGESFTVVSTEKEAKTISLRRQQLQREQSFRQIRMITLDQISERIKHGEVQELPLIIKGDVHGSVEAIADSLMKLKTDEVGVTVIQKGVGAITEGDVLLASTSHAVIFGFHVHANKKARELAAHEKVEIKSYRIIYDIVDDVKKALEGLLRPEISEVIQGEVEVRNLFKISAIGTIAGCHVSEGKITRNMKIKIYRDGVEIWDGELDSLKRFKEDVKEVASGFECGIKVKSFNDLKPGDIVQPYTIVETKRALEM
ncbi:MAG: translation initiation factor IF-2, partial [FCB group bacterium]|nr:translation initiation factor IF-2 [FCB group bacterium]